MTGSTRQIGIVSTAKLVMAHIVATALLERVGSVIMKSASGAKTTLVAIPAPTVRPRMAARMNPGAAPHLSVGNARMTTGTVRAIRRGSGFASASGSRAEGEQINRAG